MSLANEMLTSRMVASSARSTFLTRTVAPTSVTPCTSTGTLRVWRGWAVTGVLAAAAACCSGDMPAAALSSLFEQAARARGGHPGDGDQAKGDRHGTLRRC